jgi:hypothetical protein
MHLHGEQLERYERRELPRSELAAIDAHISGCLHCSRSLAQAAAASERWERRGWLGRLVRVEEPQTLASPAAEDAAAAKAA